MSIRHIAIKLINFRLPYTIEPQISEISSERSATISKESNENSEKNNDYNSKENNENSN